jgi:hypothetical protein
MAYRSQFWVRIPQEHENEMSQKQDRAPDDHQLMPEASRDAASSPEISRDTFPCDGVQREQPTVEAAYQALKDIEKILAPPRKTGRGYLDPNIDPFARIRMTGMKVMLNFYTNGSSATYGKWKNSAKQAAIGIGKGQYCAWQICKLSHQFIEDRQVLPVNPYGEWNESMLADDDLASDIRLFLQELGLKEITAQKLLDFLLQQDIMEKYEITKKLTVIGFEIA